MNLSDVPVPRNGLWGFWDRLVGPGMTVYETLLVIAASVSGALAAASFMAASGSSPLRVGIASLIGFDVVGGAVCNGSWTTRAWYHRSGRTWVHHLAFLLPHLAYVAVVAGFFRGPVFDGRYAIVFGAGLVCAMVAVLRAPTRLKTPVAFLGYMLVLFAILFGVGSTPAMGWFEPALMLKLLLGHAIPNTTEVTDIA